MLVSSQVAAFVCRKNYCVINLKTIAAAAHKRAPIKTHTIYAHGVSIKSKYFVLLNCYDVRCSKNKLVVQRIS